MVVFGSIKNWNIQGGLLCERRSPMATLNWPNFVSDSSSLLWRRVFARSLTVFNHAGKVGSYT